MFSVIIPVYNKLLHLDRAIHSVLNQTFRKFELILIDDASTDGSSEKLKEYKDSRITLYRRDSPGPGGYAARNLGIKKAKHDWISFLDADDEWHEDFLLERAKLIKNNKKINIISSKYIRLENGATVKFQDEINLRPSEPIEFQLTDYLIKGEFMWTGAVSIRRELLIKAGMFPINKCNRGGDLDTWIRCLYLSENNIYLPNLLSIYYKGTINQVTDSKVNPATKLCSYKTLEKIRKNNQENRQLLSAINIFYSKYVWRRMVSTLRNEGKITKEYMSMIQSSNLKIQLLCKIYLYKILLHLNLK